MTDATTRKDRNSALLREDVAARRTVLRGLPEVVALHTTEKCDLRCTMCARSLGQGKLQLDRAVLASVCDRLFPTARKVALSAAKGEPMLADYDLVLQRARTHRVRVDLVTNSTQLDADAWREGAEVFDHVNVSVDSAVPEVYESIRVGARFARLEANLHGIAEERSRRPDDALLSLSAVVMRSTLPHLPALVDLSAAVGADGVILQPVSHSGKANHEEDPATEPGMDAVHAAFARLRTHAERLGVNLLFSDFNLPPAINRRLRKKVPHLFQDGPACWYVLQHFGVQPTGEVYPCCFPNDRVLGNVRLDEPAAIWNGAAFQELRRAHYSGRGTLFCSGCVHAPNLPPRRPEWLVRRWRDWRFRRFWFRNQKRLRRLERELG